MKALILAAGLGTRLMPLTSTTPKALVKVNGMTLLEITVRKLAAAGFNEIIVNVHHHANQVIDFLNGFLLPGTYIAISDETEQLLDTGGAILKARWFLDGKEPFLVHNVDVISNTSLHQLHSDHINRRALATLSVMERQTRRYFLFDRDLRLCGWTDTSTGEIQWADKPDLEVKKLAFSGIHMISPEIFNVLEEKGRFSVIDSYLKLASKYLIYGHVQDGLTWFDLGKPEQIEVVSKFLNDHPDFIPGS